MAKATDTRIVQMMFDNKQFERGVKTSEKSLEKFKKELDFDKYEKGLTNFGKAVKNLSFDHLADNVQKLTDKFTGLGNVTELVLSQIRRGIESTASKVSGFINSLGFEQISAGMGKFEQLNKNVQTIMAATGRSEEEVMKVMKRLNDYTDQTSYNFTDMAANIGKFTSVGIKLEDAEKQMEGIANWAARSGAGIQEASRAMYNLSQAMGAGKMLKIDWKSIENAGMATQEFKEQMIQAGIAAGTLEVDKKGVVKTAKSLGKQVEVTYKNMSETLSKGWANTKVLGSTLERYYQDDLRPWLSEEPGKAMLELSDTQKQAFDKMIKADNKLNKANYKTLENMGVWTSDNKQKILDLAVSQGKLTETVDKEGKKQYEAVGKNGKKIQFTIEDMEDSLTSGWFDKGLYDTATSINKLALESYEAAQKCKSFTDVIGAWKDQLSTGWMNFWQHVFGGLTESMEIFSNICNKVGDSFSDLMRVLNGGYQELEDGTRVWQEGIMGNWASMGGRDSLWSLFIGDYDGMYEGAYGLLDVLKDIGKMISDGFWLMIKMMDPNSANVSDEDWLANETYRTQELGYMLKDATDKVRNFIQGIKDFFTEVPAGAKKTRFQQIQDVVNGVMSTALVVYDTVRDIIGFVGTLLDDKHLGPAIDAIIGVFSNLGQELSKTAGETHKGKGLKYFLDQFLEILGNKDEGLIKAVNDFVGAIANLVNWLIGADTEGSKTISVWQSIADVLIKVLKVVTKVVTPIVNFFATIVDSITALAKGDINFDQFAKNLKSGLKTMINSIFSFTPDFTGKVKAVIDNILGVFTSGFSAESVEKMKNGLRPFFDKLKNLIPQGVKDGAKNIVQKIRNAFEPILNAIKGVFEKGFSADTIESLKESLKNLWSKVAKVLTIKRKDGSEIDLSKILLGITGALGLTGIIKFAKRLKSVTKVVGGIKLAPVLGIASAITLALGGITTALGASSEDADKYLTNGEGTIFEKIIAWIRVGFEKIKDFVSDIVSGKVDLIQMIKEKLGIGTQEAQGQQQQAASILDPIINFFKTTFNSISEFFRNIGDKIKKVAGPAIDAIKSIDLSQIALLIIGALGVYGIVKLIKRISSLIESIETVGKNISEMPKNLAEAMKSQEPEEESFADKFLKIAGAVAIIAAAAYALGTLPLEKAIQGVAAVGLLMIGLAVMVTIMKKTFTYGPDDETYNTFNSACRGMIVLSISILIAARALAKIGKLSQQEWARGVAGFILIITSFMLISKALKKGITFDWKSLSGLLAFAGALILVAIALRMLARMEWDELAHAAAAIFGLLVMLFVYVAAITKVSGSVANSGMKELAFLAAAVALLALSLVPLSKIPWERLGPALRAVAILLASLFGVVVGVNKLAKGGIGDAGMKQLIALAGTVLMLVLAIIPLSLIPSDKLWNATGVVGALIVALFGFVVGVNKLAGTGLKETAMAQLLALAGTVVLLVLALIPLTLLPYGKLWSAVGAVVVLVAALFGFVVGVNKLAGTGLKGTGMTQLLAVAGAVIILVLAMIPLSLMPIDSLFSAAGAILLLLLGMTAITWALSKLKGGKQAIANMGMLVILAGVIYVFANALNQVKTIKPSLMIAFGVGLAALIGVMALAASAFSKMTVKGIVLAVAGVSALILAMSLVVPALISAIGGSLGNVAVNLTTLANALEIFSDSLASVNQNGVSNGENTLYRIKEMIQQIVAMNGYGQQLNQFTTMLYDLGTTMEGFARRSNGIGDVSQNSVMSLIKDLSACARNLDTITKLNIAELTARITELGGAMSIYAIGAQEMAQKAGVKGVEDIDEDAVSAAVEIMKKISEKLADKDGVIIPKNIPEDQEVALFGAALVALAKALIDFEQAGQGLGEGKDKALEVLDYFAALKTRLDETKFVEVYNEVTGSFTKEKIDVNSLTEFAKNIESLGSALKTFSEMTTYEDTDVASGVEDTFGTFGKLKSTVAKNFKKVRKPLDFTGAFDVLDEFVKLGDKLPTKAWWQIFSGRQMSLTEFGSQVQLLGVNLKSFSDSVTGTNPETGRPNYDTGSMSVAIAALDQMATFMEGLKNRQLPRLNSVVDDIRSFFTGEAKDWTLGQLTDEVGKMGSGLRAFGQALKDGHWDEDLGIDQVLDTLSSVADVILQMDEIKGFISDPHGYVWALGEFLADLANPHIKNGPDSYDESSKSVIELIVEWMKTLSDAFDKYGIVDNGQIKLFKTFADAIYTLSNVNRTGDWAGLGDKITQGMKSGIERGASSVIDAAVKMALDSYRAAKAALDLELKGLEEGLSETPETTEWGYTEEKPLAEWTDQGLADEMQKRLAEQAEKNPVKVDAPVEVTPEISNLLGLNGFDSLEQFLDIKGLTGSSLSMDELTSMLTGNGENAALGFASGWQDGEADIMGALKSTGIEMPETMANLLGEKSPSRVFMKIGRYASMGLALGIKQKSQEAIKTAGAMIRGTIEVARETAKVQSPSRVFMELGEYLGAGLVLGLDSSTGSVTKASVAMANASINAMKDALGIRSPSKEFEKIALMCATGLVSQEDKNSRMVTKSFTEGLVDKPMEAMREQTEEDMKELEKQAITKKARSTLPFGIGNLIQDETLLHGAYYGYQKGIGRFFDAINGVTAKTAETTVTDTEKKVAKIFLGSMYAWLGSEAAYYGMIQHAHESNKGKLFQTLGRWALNVYSDMETGVKQSRGKIREMASGFISSIADTTKEIEDRAVEKVSEVIDDPKSLIMKAFGQGKETNEASNEVNDLVSSLIPVAKAEPEIEIDEEKAKKGLFGSILNFWRSITGGGQEKNTEKQGFDLTSTFGLGMAEGMESSLDPAANAVMNVVGKMFDAGCKAADAHSPSRVFMQLGEYMSQGLTFGLLNADNSPEEAVGHMVDSMKERLQLAINNLSLQIAEGIDTAPTITPVLDLSNVQNGMRGIPRMFNNPYGLNFGGGTLTLDPSGASFYANQAIPKDYTSEINNVKTEVANMRSDLRTLSEAMRQTKFVFQTGQVVAAIGPEMDRYLAQQGYYAARSEIP